MPDTAKPEIGNPVPWDQVMGGIGSLIFLTVALENSLKAALSGLGDGIERSMLGILIAKWESLHDVANQSDPTHADLVRQVVTRLRYILDRRNSLIHGLSGARASFHADDDPAGYYIGSGAGHTFLQFHQLQRDLAMMCHLPDAIEALTAAIQTPYPSGAAHPCEFLRLNLLPEYR